MSDSYSNPSCPECGEPLPRYSPRVRCASCRLPPMERGLALTEDPPIGTAGLRSNTPELPPSMWPETVIPPIRRKKINLQLEEGPPRDLYLKIAVILLIVGTFAATGALLIFRYASTAASVIPGSSRLQPNGMSDWLVVLLGTLGAGSVGLMVTLWIRALQRARRQRQTKGSGPITGCLVPLLGVLILCAVAAGVWLVLSGLIPLLPFSR